MKTLCEFHGEQEGERCPICPSVYVPPLECLMKGRMSQCSSSEQCIHERQEEDVKNLFRDYLKNVKRGRREMDY